MKSFNLQDRSKERFISLLCLRAWTLTREVAVPAAWDVHPEFGLLCISARLRRRLRLGFFCVACALLAGTIASKIYVAGDGAEARQAFALAPAHASRTVAPEPRAASQASAGRRSSRLCAGAWSFLDGTCTFGAPRRMQHVRSLAAPPALASVLIGRAGAPVVQATATPRSAAAEAADEAVSASIVTQPAAAEAPAQSAHPERKQAHGEAGKRHHAVAAQYAEQGRRGSSGRGGWGSLW
jgi:hypothetical protein